MVRFRIPILRFELEVKVRVRDEGKSIDFVEYLIMKMFDVFFDGVNELGLILLNGASNLNVYEVRKRSLDEHSAC